MASTWIFRFEPSRLKPLAHLLNTPVGQSVGMLISRVAVVPTHPVPVNLVPSPVGQGVQALPEVCVFDLLLGRGAPVARFPSRQPFGDAF